MHEHLGLQCFGDGHTFLFSLSQRTECSIYCIQIRLASQTEELHREEQHALEQREVVLI